MRDILETFDTLLHARVWCSWCQFGDHSIRKTWYDHCVAVRPARWFCCRNRIDKAKWPVRHPIPLGAQR
jgi:hypothetical protein